MFDVAAGVSVASIEEAIDCGMHSSGRNLEGKILDLAVKTGLTWRSAPSTALAVLVAAKPIFTKLLRLCPNTAVPGKKLDQALVSINAKGDITSKAKFDLHDAELISERIRQCMAKLRMCTAIEQCLGMEPKTIFQMYIWCNL